MYAGAPPSVNRELAAATGGQAWLICTSRPIAQRRPIPFNFE
jgi:hypothetical protein